MNNKKIKVISSMAVAGLLTLNVFSANALVAQAKEVDDTVNATRPLGVYRSLISGENKAVAPVVVQKDKTTLADDYVTVNELVNSDKISTITAFNGKSINSVSRKEMVKTGDTITIAGGETVTVVVYGDVNKDGLVDGDDASAILKYDVDPTGSPLDSIQKLAADVKNSGSNKGVVDGDDASHILKYEVGLPDVNAIEVEPKAEEANYKYTLSVEGGYINNQNNDAVTVNIGLTPADEDITGLTLKVLDPEGKDVDSSVTTGVTFNKIDAHVNLQQVSGFDFSDNTKTPDGTYTIQLLDKDNKVVGETTVEKNIVTPTAAKVVAKRLNTKEANLSLEGYGTELKKVYYSLNEITDTSKVEYLEVKGNKLVDEMLKEELANNTSYKLHYRLENIYGSLSADATTTIAKDGNSVKEEETVTNITVPTLKDTDINFSWTAPKKPIADPVVYTVTLYKDGKIIAENNDVKTTNIDFTGNMNEIGKYKIGVVVNGASDGDKIGTSTNSEEVLSGEVEVKQLQKVSKIEFTIPEDSKDTTRMLSWEDNNAEGDVAGYTINVYKYDETNKKYPSEPTDTIKLIGTDTKKVNLKDAKFAQLNYETNKMYKAEVIANADSKNKAIISSKSEVSKEFFEVNVSKVETKNSTDSSVTLGDISNIKVSGVVPTFKVKIYVPESSKDDLSTVITKYNYLTTKDAIITEDGKNIIVNGLTQNIAYKFKLVADVNGVQGESEPIIGTTLPIIKGLKRVEEKDAKVSGTIFYDKDTATKAYIDGKEITTTDYGEAQTSLEGILKIVEKIHVNDIITVSDDAIIIDASASKAEDDKASIDFEATAAGKKLVLTGKSKTQRIVKATKGDGKQPAEVTLQGNEAMFDTKDLNADKVILTNGVEVVNAQTSQEYTISANATVTINGVKIHTDKETTILVAGTNTLNVKLEQGTVTNNNLTFTNNKGKAVVIGFEAITNGNPATYIGTITIDSTGGSATVTTESTVNVNDVKLNVIAKDATVDVSNAGQTNNNSITTTVTDDGITNKKNSVTFVSKKAVPTALNVEATGIELKDYSDDDIKTLCKDSDAATSDDIKEIREFINSFNLNGKGAKITSATTPDNKVNITFTKAGTYTVGGIK